MEISKKLYENQLYIENKLGLSTSFDVGVRELNIKGKKVLFYYITGLTDSSYVIEILKKVVNINEIDAVSDFDILFKNHLVHQQVDDAYNLNDVIDKVLNGLMGVVVEGSKKAYIIDVRSYPGRNPEEPDTERVVRGSRDGFVENIVVNTALIRRRVRDQRLRMELLSVGKYNKTDVCIAYIEDKCDEKLVNDIRSKIQKINVDELSMADKALEELIISQGFNPYPKVRYTERPDIVSTHLYQGIVAIIVDTSPSVILTPTTLFDHMTHAEEYRQAPFIGTFMRFIRYGGILASVLLVPLWFMFVMSPELLPESLSFIGPEEEGNIPLVIQIIIAEIGIEFLRMAAIHTPSPLSTAMGIIAGVLIGQIAIDVGMFSPEVVLYVAVSAIGSYSTPSYELALANKISKIFIIICVAIFGVYGLLGSVLLWIIFLGSIKVFNKRYLYPFFPPSLKGIKNLIIRSPKKNKKK